jgi:hypothetical protein
MKMEKMKDYLFKIKYHKMDMFLFSLLIMGLGVWAGGVIDRNRTPENQDPNIKLYSPLAQLPNPNEVVYVVYPWGALHARYLKGEGKNKDLWLEYSFLHDGEAGYDLVETFGILPVWWGYDYPTPRGMLDDKNIERGIKK